MKQLKNNLQSYCDQINSVLKKGNEDEIKEVINKVVWDMSQVEDSNLYFSRAVFIANNCNVENAKKDLLRNPEDYIFAVSDDLEEHPGITIHFRDTTKDEIY